MNEEVTLKRHGNSGRRKLFCVRGHKLVEPNLYYNREGTRQCKTCAMERGIRTYAKKIEKRAIDKVMKILKSKLEAVNV